MMKQNSIIEDGIAERITTEVTEEFINEGLK